MEEIQGLVQEVRSRLAYCVDGWKPKHPFDFFDLRRFEFMKNSYKGFDHFWWFEDHRYAMMSSLVYLYIVVLLAPACLGNGSKPMKVKWLIVPYNFGLVAFNAYIFHEFLAAGWATNYNLGCVNARPYSNDEQSNRMANASFLYFISKHIEFMDTFLFIVMQKWRNVSTLHVFHHSSMAYATWWTTKFAPTGYGTFGPMLNSFIHVLMYSYYGLAALGPELRPYLWWKKYLTSLQMIQFCAVLAHMTNILCNHPGCQYPIGLNILQLVLCGIFLGMFAKFYRKTYETKPTAISSEKNALGTPTYAEIVQAKKAQ
ncbi:unnamed protein product [Oikopleura dioica]|uniref:Elongation of very long chain fatty acids protein n=1 Tax=Oikopleura dioica TaxID=34765 RepID=E4XWM6_OIKDI|nr:unnamed protein product [Oikopleura dioica]CBY33185.1 unnamed protein product [Oikopleura dioica]